jgi:AhpC/TSA family protein
MKRRWNASIWTGLLVVLAALVSFVPIVMWSPDLRDRPWATLLFLAAGLLLIARGLRLAYREPQLYRGRIAGPIVMVLGIALAGLFTYGVFVAARQVPAALGAPHVGQKAPEFSLLDQEGRTVTLSDLLGHAPEDAGVVLIFYRGYW